MTPLTAILKLLFVVLLCVVAWLLIPTAPTAVERIPVALGMAALFAAGALFQGIRWSDEQ